MAYTPIGAMTGGGDGATSFNGVHTLTPPAGLAVGHLMLVRSIGLSTTATATIASGSGQTWTVVSGPDASSAGTAYQSYLWAATAVSGDLSNNIVVTWTTSVTGIASGIVYPAGSVRSNAFATSAGGGSAQVGTDVSATTGDSLVQFILAKKNSGVTPPTFTTPTGYTLDIMGVTNGAGTNFRTAIFHKGVSSTGSQGADSTAFNVTTANGGAASTLALAPAAVAPTANAGPDQTNIDPGVVITLDGTASSGNGGATIVSHAWSQTSGVSSGTITGSGATVTTVAPPNSSGTVLTYSLTVTDSNGLTNTDTVNITVLASTEFIRNASGGWDPITIVARSSTGTWI